ncbi:hypothetical protein PR003_g17655 [Phytophthora rubi]|uniref:Uncharacterized protein n=1 Tax=Phytophthora rubi TaxID=129364 RepID=A0A6A3KC43_9STRA|nr:hypothetical protein PR002_g16971 [Phytophthora rubi]KAE9320699.1 hypothetical protein PR003_g17655 [Phytophthora rubi]
MAAVTPTETGDSGTTGPTVPLPVPAGSEAEKEVEVEQAAGDAVICRHRQGRRLVSVGLRRQRVRPQQRQTADSGAVSDASGGGVPRRSDGASGVDEVGGAAGDMSGRGEAGMEGVVDMMAQVRVVYLMPTPA